MNETKKKTNKCLTVIYNKNAKEVVKEAEELVLRGWVPLGGVQSIITAETITAEGGHEAGFHTTTTNEVHWYWSLWKPLGD